MKTCELIPTLSHFHQRSAVLFTVILFTVAAPVLVMQITPVHAQFVDVRQKLKTLPTSQVIFAPGTNSTTIENSSNVIYIIRARARQRLSLRANSLGARASVTLYGVDGKSLGLSLRGFSNQSQEKSLLLPKTGDYYIVGGAGPTHHFYNFTLTIK